jgi:hypothetical protein
MEPTRVSDRLKSYEEMNYNVSQYQRTLTGHLNYSKIW